VDHLAWSRQPWSYPSHECRSIWDRYLMEGNLARFGTYRCSCQRRRNEVSREPWSACKLGFEAMVRVSRKSMRWRVNFHCRRWSERNAVLMERSKSKENRGDGEEGPRSQSLWHGYYPMAELQTLSAARISAGNRTQPNRSTQSDWRAR
jgi:hypothetical protein